MNQVNNNNFGMRPGHYYAGLGITANSGRVIGSGIMYEGLFPKTQGTDPIVKPNAEVHDTLHFVATVVKKTLPDTIKVVARLMEANNLPATLKNIFNFHYKNYHYKLDKPGVEQVRRPARSWIDRKKGIDCDCFTTSVSSMLTNLGITHYLKIIGIKDRPYYQHIYVVVPKFKDADINVKSNYWTIDPVLNRFDEEALEITKKDYLKMSRINGIPLQYLNGLGCNNNNLTSCVNKNIAGLGSEFDDLDQHQGVGSLDEPDELGYMKFKRAMHQHVRNTAKKIRHSPNAVNTIYNPAALAGLYDDMDRAFSGSDDELVGALEEIAKREEQTLQPLFAGLGSAINIHDDYLYGAMFGEIDEEMIGIVSGLGRKKKSKGILKKIATKIKTGPATKIKNAVKKAKVVTKKVAAKTKVVAKKVAAKTKVVAKKVATKTKAVAKKTGAALKKIAKAVVKFSPIALAARGGMLVAMRTNFGFMAERAYWGYFTQQQAAAKGISAAFWAKCKKLLDKITKTFTGKVLQGSASALKKAIMNGRGAKKVSKKVKSMGMLGSTSELMGLGVVTTAASLTAAAAFITPILAFMKGLFKGKRQGTIENENGTESAAPSDDINAVVSETIEDTNNATSNLVENDSSIESAARANNEPPSEEENSDPSISVRKAAAIVEDSPYIPSTENRSTSPSKDEFEPEQEEGSLAPIKNTEAKPAEPAKKSNGAVFALVGLAAAAALAFALKGSGDKAKTKKPALDGLGNFSKKRESNNLKTQLHKKGVKMPHGYAVEKRKPTKIQTIKLK